MDELNDNDLDWADGLLPNQQLISGAQADMAVILLLREMEGLRRDVATLIEQVTSKGVA